MMKRIIAVFLILSPMLALAHAPADSTSKLLLTAKALANPKKPFFNPNRSFNIYTQLAAKGNAEAMNGLGVLYSKGIGVTEDDQVALSWFERSAKGGYGNAYYNWGTMIKFGLGTPQDFTKAFNCYKQGADLGFGTALYGEGFMLYKGLGCTQSYEQAFQAFAKSADLDCQGGMYMKGLCYRNGYGIAVNLDSARYWLNKAASLGYQFAKDELAAPEPENTNISNAVVIMPPATGQQNPVPDIKAGYQKVKHQLSANDIDGDYTGYTIKFDWSGKHIIGESTLDLKLNHSGKTLKGNWTEDGSVSTTLDAKLTDTALVFNNTSYSRLDHYDTKTPNDFEFKNAQMQLVKDAGNVYITGNLQLYSTKFKEPEKPTFVMLIRNDNRHGANSADSTNNLNGNTAKTDSVKFIVYPNPFTNTLNAQFILKQACSVRLIISSLMDARIVYQGAAQQMEAGEHTITLSLNSIPGTYVCTLNYGNQLKSAVVFKQ